MQFSLFKKEVLELNVIPKAFFGENKNDFSWFYKTPKYSTFRVNTMVTSSDDVISTIKKQILSQLSKIGSDSLPEIYIHSVFKDCVVVGSLSSTLNTGDKSSSEVLIDNVCAAAVLRGAHIFAPGVLSMQSGVKEGDLVDVYCDLERKCKKGFQKVFDGTKFFIGTGIVKMDRNKLFNHQVIQSGVAIEMIKSVSGVPSFSLPPNLGILQNFPSIVCCYTLDLSEDHCVLDMCSAPGNKTSHISVLMGNKGTVIALDKSENKVSQVRAKMKQLELHNVTCFAVDAREAALDLPSRDLSLGPPFPENSFDRVLLDAPCSALGKRPQLSNSISPSQIKSFPPLQKQLFAVAYRLLKPGGVMVYSTCTITVEENEAVVTWGLSKCPLLTLVKPEAFFGSPGIECAGLSSEQTNCLLRFGMSSGHTPEEDTVGFFIAKFIKSTKSS